MGVLERLGTSGPALGAVVVSTLCVYAFVVLLTRLAGPRSLANMSSFDFAATVAVAVGSTLASTALGSVPLVDGAAPLVLLFGLQAIVAVLRRRGAFGGLVDSRPLLLMAGSEVLDDHMRQARMSPRGAVRTAPLRRRPPSGAGDDGGPRDDGRRERAHERVSRRSGAARRRARRRAVAVSRRLSRSARTSVTW